LVRSPTRRVSECRPNTPSCVRSLVFAAIPPHRRLPRMPPPGSLLDCHLWRVERRGDGAIVVRVSSQREGRRLPDAVFAFRSGDPQYGYWEERFLEQQTQCGEWHG
jgi:hypothetical protein